MIKGTAKKNVLLSQDSRSPSCGRRFLVLDRATVSGCEPVKTDDASRIEAVQTEADKRGDESESDPAKQPGRCVLSSVFSWLHWCVANAVSTSACVRFMQRVTTDSPVCKQGLGICTNHFCLPILAAAIIFR